MEEAGSRTFGPIADSDGSRRLSAESALRSSMVGSEETGPDIGLKVTKLGSPTAACSQSLVRGARSRLPLAGEAEEGEERGALQSAA